VAWLVPAGESGYHEEAVLPFNFSAGAARRVETGAATRDISKEDGRSAARADAGRLDHYPPRKGKHMNTLQKWNPLGTTRWDPFREMEDAQERLNRVFGLAPSRGNGGQELMSVSEWAPLVDITEDGKEFLIECELPEVKKQDVNVCVENAALTITGERNYEHEEKTKKQHRIERNYGRFERSFILPDGADAPARAKAPARTTAVMKLPAQPVRFEYHDGAADRICIAGSFNDWSPSGLEMIAMGDGRWAKALLPLPGTYEYRLVVDGRWMPDPAAGQSVRIEFGEANSLLHVAAGPSSPARSSEPT
jgi:HSP20 family protein